MPSGDDGFKTAIYVAFIAIVISATVNAFSRINPEFQSLALLIEISSIFGVIEIIDNMTYWGIGYSIGYLLGVTLVSRIMAPWEYTLLSLFLVIALVQKIIRKFGL